MKTNWNRKWHTTNVLINNDSNWHWITDNLPNFKTNHYTSWGCHCRCRLRNDKKALHSAKMRICRPTNLNQQPSPQLGITTCCRSMQGVIQRVTILSECLVYASILVLPSVKDKTYLHKMSGWLGIEYEITIIKKYVLGRAVEVKLLDHL